LEQAPLRSIAFRDDLPTDAVRHVMVDSRGRLWGATLGAGVFQFDGENVQTLTEDDGLPSNYSPAIVEDVDGSILIATYRGIRRYMPAPPHPPSIRIVGVDVHERHDTRGSITVQAGSGRTRIVYRGASLMTARMRYTYMLEGVDDGWQSTWDEEVVYKNLPQGNYSFKVKRLIAT
jgi:hypothetical protein